MMIALNMGTSNLPVLRIGRLVVMIYNVAMVGRFAQVGSPTRVATCKVLRLMGRKFGISLAFIFATALEENRISSSVIEYQVKADAWIVGEASNEPLVGGSPQERS